MNSSERLYGLDIVRAIAILLVIYAHSFKFFKSDYFFLFDGVILFFVLSGFLIGTILIKTFNQNNLKFSSVINFWIRRWLRTLPAYYLVLFVILLINVSVLNVNIKEFFSYFFFTQTIQIGWAKFYPESWSLCIEEWFYLTLPFLIYLSVILIKDRRSAILFWILFILVAGTIFRIFITVNINVNNILEWQSLIRQPLLMRLDSIMYGVLGSFLCYYRYKIWHKKNQLFILGIIVCIICCINYNFYEVNWFLQYLHLSFGALASLFLLPKLSTTTTKSVLVRRIVTFISKVSYSVYLINLTPFNWIEPYLPKQQYLLLLCFLIWSFAGAYLMYRFVEQPFINFRDKFFSKL